MARRTVRRDRRNQQHGYPPPKWMNTVAAAPWVIYQSGPGGGIVTSKVEYRR